MVTRVTAAGWGEAINSPAASEWPGISPTLNLLILVQIEHIEHMAFAVDQQGPPGVYDTFQIIRQFRQLILAGQRQGLSLILHLGRQASAPVYLAFRPGWQFRTLCGSGGKVRSMFSDAAADRPAIAKRK